MSLVSWAVLGWIATAEPLTPVRAAISALHLTVALSIARRARLVRVGFPQAILASLPSLVVAGLAFRLSAPLPEWHITLRILFFVGAGIAVVTFLTLGESFAVLPALRGIVSRGPYRLVRHPAYAGEFLMILACVFSSLSVASAIVLLLALPLLALRIGAEERLLGQAESYRRYAASVPFRLVPGLW